MQWRLSLVQKRRLTVRLRMPSMQAMPPDLHTPHGHTAPATASAHARQTDIQARFWDRMAHRYARGAIADRAAYERTLERTAHWLAPQHDVLEVGCGTGATA